MCSHLYPAHLSTRPSKPSSNLPRNCATLTHTPIFHSQRHLPLLSVLDLDRRPPSPPDHLLSAPLLWVSVVRLSHLASVPQRLRSPVTAACGRNISYLASHLTSMNSRPRAYPISPISPCSPPRLRLDQRLHLLKALSGISCIQPRLLHSSRLSPAISYLNRPLLRRRSCRLFCHVCWTNGRHG